MTEQILKIADDLRRLAIDEQQARNLLLDLFGVSDSFADVMAMLPIGMVNRIEVIDEKGRSYVNWQKYNRVELQVQDNGRTLKVFVSQGN